MELKFGYFYLSRDGAMHGPLIPASGACSKTHPFANGRGTTWRPDGGYMLQECSNGRDLVQEIGSTEKRYRDECKVTAQQAAMIAVRDQEIAKLRAQCTSAPRHDVANSAISDMSGCTKRLTEELARANSAISTLQNLVRRCDERMGVLYTQVEAARNALRD